MSPSRRQRVAAGTGLVVRAEVHYHEERLVTVALDCAGDGKPEFGEFLLAALFATRTMTNLHPSTAKLAYSLAGLASEIAEGLQLSAGSLQDHRHTRGPRGFAMALRLEPTGPRFTSKPWGFGMLGRDLKLFGQAAPSLLVANLVERRASDAAYAAGMATLCEVLVDALLDGQVNVRTQVPVAMAATTVAFQAAYDG